MAEEGVAVDGGVTGVTGVTADGGGVAGADGTTVDVEGFNVDDELVPTFPGFCCCLPLSPLFFAMSAVTSIVLTSDA